MKQTMTAVVQDGLGGPEVLYLTETDRPVPGFGEVLVRVSAAGVNPIDGKTRESGAFLGWPPFVLGWDVSGVVEETGPGVRLFESGDEVYGMPAFPAQAGAYAEYVVAPARHFAPKPGRLTHVEAAALPLAALTARQALVDAGRVRPGDRVVVHGAAGGVGHLAVQIAKALGAYVIATARAAQHPVLRELGADELLDFTEVDVHAAIKDADFVLDPLGGQDAFRALESLRDGGTLVSLPSPEDDAVIAAAAERRIRAGFMLVQPDPVGLHHIAALADAGKVRPLVAATFPLAEVARAHRFAEAGGVTGKTVLTIR
ncbi:NADP-dependent oxidoreductase [Streptomyces sp. NPDC006487]|uniref:NADP-dependent oxidoreductase n=1 Tax=Streptomyces sp. NPDC006487 TaxID=3364748 RepID=UPI0036A440AC